MAWRTKEPYAGARAECGTPGRRLLGVAHRHRHAQRIREYLREDRVTRDAAGQPRLARRKTPPQGIDMDAVVERDAFDDGAPTQEIAMLAVSDHSEHGGEHGEEAHAHGDEAAAHH